MTDILDRLKRHRRSPILVDAKNEIERLRGDLEVTKLQRDARMVSEFVVDDAVKDEIARYKLVIELLIGFAPIDMPKFVKMLEAWEIEPKE